MYAPHLIHSFVRGHLVCVGVLVIVNSVAMNIGLNVSFCDLWFSTFIWTGVGFPGHRIALF